MLKAVIEEVLRKRILPESYQFWSELKGGTNSKLGIISSSDSSKQYVVKLNTPKQIASEIDFYKLYHAISLLPNVFYADPECRFFIYQYVPGQNSYARGTKETLMNELIERVVRYYVQPASQENYRWIEDPIRTKEDIDYARSIIGTHISSEDHRLILDIHVRRSARVKNERLYVLHGDFGIHNFLFEKGMLSGVIDPIPGLGRPLYDILYAFCSSPDDLHLSVLLPVVEQLGTEKIHEADLVDDMIIALYLRISTCLLHHPNDLPEYLNAWNEWVH
jgi:hypothetical protein